MSFKEKFLATRVAIENILFEKDVSVVKKINKKTYFFLFLIIFLYSGFSFYYFYSNQYFIDYFLKINDYLHTSIKEILFTTDIFKPFSMPVYHIIFKILSYYIEINIWIFSIINILIIALGILGFFKLIAFTKNEYSAITSVIALVSTPFFIQLTRTPSPDVLSFLSIIWVYYFYIKMKNEEQYNSVPFYIFFYSLGLLSDKFFILYTLPCLSFTTFLFTTRYSNYAIFVLVPSAIISFIFYLRFILLYIIRYSVDKIDLHFLNLKFLFSYYTDSLGILFFIFFPFFIWMIFSVYNVYVAKKEVSKWFFYPALVYLIFPFSDDYLKFTIPAVIAGFSVMIFAGIRRYINLLLVFLAILYGGEILPVSNVSAQKGYLYTASIQYKIVKNILYSLAQDNLRPKTELLVPVNIKNMNVSADFFEIMKKKYSLDNLKFVSLSSDIFPFSCYVITDRKTREISNFKEMLLYKGIFLLKNPYCDSGNSEGLFNISSIRYSGLELSDVVFRYDPEKNTVLVDIGYLGYNGIDMYGVKLEIENAIVNTHNPYYISGFSSIKIINAVLNQYSVDRYLEKFKDKKTDIELLDEVIKFSRILKLMDVVGYFSIEIKEDAIYFKVLNLKFGFFEFGYLFSDFLSFQLPFEKLPLPVRFSKLKVAKELIRIS